jgi:GAF domain-containing protein
MRLALIRLSSAVADLPRPRDSPHAHASGADPDRVLLFGSGPAVGYGVLSHDLALPGQLARQISAGTGRGTDVDVVADPDLVVQTAARALIAFDLGRYDSIVLSIGANNSLLLTSPRVWRRELRAVLDLIVDQVPADTGIYIVAVPPLSSIDVSAGYVGTIAARHANRLNAESRRLALLYASVTFVPFSPLVRADFTRYRSASTYQQWASVIAAPLITDLRRGVRPASGTADRGRSDELARQHALDAIGIVNSAPEERFTRIAVLGKQLFGVEQTLISFLDHERLWIKAAGDPDLLGEPVRVRSGSFSDWTIRQPAPFVVEDAALDPRFASSELVTEVGIRFFAGYPIETSFGVRIGTVSVLSRAPRSWTESDTTLLRDLALMVQRELAGS